MLKISDCMSKTPDTVGEDIGISEAKEFMIEKGYHHLPVLSTGILTGIISYRDIEFAQALVEDRHEEFRAGDIMSLDPYVVEPDADLKDVIKTMKDKGISSAIVSETKDTPWGIFTMNDALNLLIKFLGTEKPEDILKL